jgi:uncharacterized protein (TIGR02118 family)
LRCAPVASRAIALWVAGAGRPIAKIRPLDVSHRFRSLPAMKCITVFYPSKDNDTFDHEFYRKRHAPLIENILGKSLHKIEVRRGLAAPDGTPPLYTAVISIWIADWDAYEKAAATASMSARVRASNVVDRNSGCSRCMTTTT